LSVSIGYITPHFSWAESACHDGTPIPTGLQPNARRLAEMAERIRTRFGHAIIPVSWYRTPAWNLRVGGAVGSRHMAGDALDGRPSDISNLLALLHCVEGMLRAGELPELGGLGTYPGWVHIDCRPKPASGHVARWSGSGVGSEQ
jgi:uncharacterized protein YcbK (DUF882 family)